ncbi:MAG: hypothetical protein GY799_04505, partial [Desulfobulbaceae bacterium]|nr:hypothetical protein [Desulfobulbaceae bacterium]
AQGDAIPALLRSGETILTPKDSKKLLNSGNTSNNSNVTITAPITIQGNADQAVLEMLPSVIVETIENAQFNGMFNRNYM